MVKITCIEDLDNISDSGANYISKKELQQLLSLYEIDNISCFGSIFLIQDNLYGVLDDLVFVNKNILTALKMKRFTSPITNKKIEIIDTEE